MKIKTLAMVVVSALSLSSAAVLADTTTVNGGTVHFKGEVVNAACAVDAGLYRSNRPVRSGAFRETCHRR